MTLNKCNDDGHSNIMWHQSRKVMIGNLYLTHAIAFVDCVTIITKGGQEEPPSEPIMRLFEAEAGISELECIDFRNEVVKQIAEFRMDYLYSKLGDAFQVAADVVPEIDEWLDKYPYWN